MSFVKDLISHLDTSAEAIVDQHGATTQKNMSERHNNDGPEDPENFSGYVVVNGVKIPQNVYTQLSNLGIPLGSYSESDLRAAVDACRIDTQLIDDPNGINFHDKLHLAPDEKAAAEVHGTWTDRVGRKNLDATAQSFCDQLLTERANTNIDFSPKPN